MRNDNDTPDMEALKSQMNPLLEQGLFKSRTILVTGEINDKLARNCQRTSAGHGRRRR